MVTAMLLNLVRTSDRPALADITGRWRRDAFWRDRNLDDVLASERRDAACGNPTPRTLVLLSDGEPVGMASLVEHDLDERPDLTPWLAGVFVRPEARGRGHAGRLVAAVEAEARVADIPVLWLYTSNAERIHARAGWRTVEAFPRDGEVCVLMRRDLALGSGVTAPSG